MGQDFNSQIIEYEASLDRLHDTIKSLPIENRDKNYKDLEDEKIKINLIKKAREKRKIIKEKIKNILQDIEKNQLRNE
jgi:transcriptional regulator NrdR family protein